MHRCLHCWELYSRKIIIIVIVVCGNIPNTAQHAGHNQIDRALCCACAAFCLFGYMYFIHLQFGDAARTHVASRRRRRRTWRSDGGAAAVTAARKPYRLAAWNVFYKLKKECSKHIQPQPSNHIARGSTWINNVCTIYVCECIWMCVDKIYDADGIYGVNVCAYV